MKLSTATEGFLIHLKSEGYSTSTVNLYKYALDNLSTFLEDPEIEKVKTNDIKAFFLHLRESYKPKRLNSKDKTPLSGSTLQNHWKGIRSFYKWTETDLGNTNRPDLNIKMPKNNHKEVQPLSEEEIRKLLKAADSTNEYKPTNRKSYHSKRRNAKRDVAVIALLLDTGIRVGELCRLNIGDLNLEQLEIFVNPFGNSKNKTKSRVIPIGRKTKNYLWLYLVTRKDTKPHDPLFTSGKTGERIRTDLIRSMFEDLGELAGISNLHPHRLRHTFAIQYLRNSGDIFTLKAILGHSTFEMVNHYLQLSQVDSKNAHRRASPVDNL